LQKKGFAEREFCKPTARRALQKKGFAERILQAHSKEGFASPILHSLTH
jgi:hypothetical protein